MTDNSSTPEFGRDLPECVVRVFGDLHYKLDAPMVACGCDSEGALYTVEEGGELRRFEVATGRQHSSYPVGETESAWAFSPDCKYLVGVGDALSVWDLAGDPGPVATVRLEAGVAVAVSRSGKYAAVGLASGTVLIYAIPGGKLVARLAGGDAPPSALAFANDEAFLAVACEDRNVRVWGWEEEVLLKTLVGHTDRIEAVAWSPDDAKLATANWDTSARIWDVKTGELDAMLNGHSERVQAAAFLPEEFGPNRLATGDSEGYVRIWDFTTLQIVTAHRCGTGPATCLAVGAAGLIAAADRAWRLVVPGSPPLALPTESATAVVALAGAGDRLAVVDELGAARLLDRESGRVESTLPIANATAATAIAGVGWAIGRADGRVAIVDRTGRPAGPEIASERAPISLLAATATGTHVSAAHRYDSTLRIWNVGTGELEIVIPEATLGGSLESAEIHPKDNVIALAGVDWDENPDAAHRLRAADWDKWRPPAGARLVRAHVPFQPRGAIVLWDADLWAVRQVLDGGARKVRFHPHGNALAAIAIDGAIVLWDHVTGDAIADLGSLGAGAVDLAFDPSGRFLAAVSHDGVAALFEARTGALVGSAELEVNVTCLDFSTPQEIVLGTANSTCLVVDVAMLAEE